MSFNSKFKDYFATFARLNKDCKTLGKFGLKKSNKKPFFDSFVDITKT